MTEFTAYSFVLNLIYCLIAVAILMLVLRRFDRMLGIDFKKDIWREIEEENNSAMAQYVGLRFLGCCVLLGLIIS
jgi:hypothetical protein